MAEIRSLHAPHHSLPKLIDTYLGERGLTRDTLVKYGCEFLGSTPIIDKLHWDPGAASYYLGGIHMPVHTREGGEYKGIASQAILFTHDYATRPSERTRVCSKGTGAPPHFLPHPDGWADNLEGELIVVCESYVKAIVAQEVLGYRTVALNGVQGWSSNGQLHEAFAAPLWRGATICIMFDSLSTTKESSRRDVLRARNTLAMYMNNLHQCEVVDFWLPEVKGGDQGVDDFVVKYGEAALEGLLEDSELMDVGTLNPLVVALEHMNTQFVMCKNPTLVVELADPSSMLKASNFELYFATSKIRAMVAGRTGKVAPREVFVAKEWLRWEKRNSASRPGFLPGEPQQVEDIINLWRGWAIQPANNEGLAEKYWLDVIAEQFPEDWEEVIEVLAAMVQRPGFNPGRMLYIMGRNGTGKNYVFEPFKYILGQHLKQTNIQAYTAKFNREFIDARMILIGEVEQWLEDRVKEALLSELKVEADSMKQKRRVEPKGAEVVYVERLALPVMLSNFAPPWSVQMGERRGIFLRTEDSLAIKGELSPWGRKTSKWWQTRWDWMNTVGAAEVMRLLLDWEVDWDGFKGPAPVTAYKREQLEAAFESSWKGKWEKIQHIPLKELEGIDFLTAYHVYQIYEGVGSVWDKSEQIKVGKGATMAGWQKSRKLRIGTNTWHFFSVKGTVWDDNKVREDYKAVQALLDRGVI